MILLYKLRNEIDNRCPNCKRKLSLRPLGIEFGKVKELSSNCIKNL